LNIIGNGDGWAPVLGHLRFDLFTATNAADDAPNTFAQAVSNQADEDEEDNDRCNTDEDDIPRAQRHGIPIVTAHLDVVLFAT